MQPRLAWFTPLPPVRSGVAVYNAELLPHLADSYAIDIFVDHVRQVDHRLRTRCEQAEPTGGGKALCLRDAHEFVWRHAHRPYDLVVYQIGNETCHDYMWAYLVRYPGLVVLHDGQLHQARARALLARGRVDDYRAELTFCHPDVPPGAARVGAIGWLGTLQYFWPMLRVPVTAARAVAVHNAWLAAELREGCPDVPVEVVRMGVADPLASKPLGAAARSETVAPGDPAALRARYRIPPDAVLFAIIGRLTPEKRIAPAMRAVATLAAQGRRVHLLLVGEPVPYYDVEAEAARWGATDLVSVAGYVADEDLASILAAVDVCLCLRWPSARETSAAWLRCLAAGRPTVVTELPHTVDAPALDPRDWSILPAALPPDDRARPSGDPVSGDEPDAAAPPVAEEPVCVAVDILDEDHSLTLALDRLAADQALRVRLGAAARARFERHHTVAHMVDDYRRLIERVRILDASRRIARTRATWPAHLRTGWTDRVRTLLADFDVRMDFLGD
jgi:glycosyltransferase involved in cell wall biosynthesis